MRTTWISVLAVFAQAGAVGQTISTVAGTDWVFPPTPLPALQAPLGWTVAVATDQGGNYYIAGSQNNQVFRVDSSGSLSIIAGNGAAAFSGDGGPATSATLNEPSGVAVDSSGNVLISDSRNNRIRRVTRDGIIDTVAGGGHGFVENGVPATSIALNFPNGVAVDSAGCFYIADTYNQKIRRVTPDGIITTVAGNGDFGFAGDGGPATSAKLGSPIGITVDGEGTVFIADTVNSRIRKVTPAGIITTVAGNGLPGYTGDGGPATSASLYYPDGVAPDDAGNLYIADTWHNAIRKVTVDGIINTVAGNGSPGFFGDGGPATSALLANPQGVAVDQAGTLLIADTHNERIRELAPDGVIATVAGDGNFRFSGDGGPAISASLNLPWAMASDSAGNLFIVDLDNHRVRKVTPHGTVVTVAGNGSTGFTGDGGLATAASLYFPYGVALDSGSALFIADMLNHRIRRVTPDGTISTVAGNGSSGFSGDGGPATNASLHDPAGIAIDSAGNLFIADYSNNRIRRVTPGGIISTVAGNGLYGYDGDGVPATTTSLCNPEGVAVDNAGNLFIADTANFRVRKVAPDGIITTLAGNGVAASLGDGGPATSASLMFPAAVAVDSVGNVFISDALSHRVRMVSLGGTITTVAGTGTSGYSGDGGPATSANLNDTFGVVVDGVGNLLVADTYNHRVRKVTGKFYISITTPSQLPHGMAGSQYSVTFAASGGTPPYVNWRITSGSLPAGLTLDSEAGVLSGTPASPGYATFVVAVDDSAGLLGANSFTLTIHPAGSALSWNRLQPSGSRPSRRADSSAVYVPAGDRMIVFGGNPEGCTPAASLNDTWVLTGATGLHGTPAWSQLFPTGGPPPARRGHSAAYNPVTDRMIVFGGDAAGCSSQKYNDVWILANASGAGGSPSWINLVPGGTPPPPRSDHVGVYDQTNNRLIVFGGTGATGNLSDLWVLTVADGLGGTPSWLKLKPTTSPPTATSFLAGTYDAITNSMTVFGGWACCQGPASNEVWFLLRANGLGRRPQWNRVAPNGIQPSARVGARGVYRPPPENSAIYFGGSGTNELWMLHNGNGSYPALWYKLSPTGAVPPRRGGIAANPAAAYDPVSKRMILFGGKGPAGIFNDVWVLAPQ